MSKNSSKICLSVLFSLLVLIANCPSAFTQKKSEIVSGAYDALIVAVNAQGELTGYFDEEAGDDGKGNSLFSCSFFIRGTKQSDGIYKIMTWYPGYSGDEVIDGELKISESNGKKAINLHLNGEHGGCWNVEPSIKEKGGINYELTKAENWMSVRVVSAVKTYFYASAEAKMPQKSFVVKNDVVRVLQTKGDAAEVNFVNNRGKTTKGWIKIKDFYAIVPPSVKI